MPNIKLNIENSGIDLKKIMEYSKNVEEVHEELHSKKDDENEFLGWLNLPTNYDKKEFSKIKKCAKK